MAASTERLGDEMRQATLFLMAIWVGACGAPEETVDPNTEDTTGTGDDDDDDDDTSIADGPLGCMDGYKSGDETGHDCGGSCENQDCCTNGYVDLELGETGVDCGGACGDCLASTYFVSNDGNDGDPGTVDQPWQTIDRVNDADLDPGDAVVLHRDGTWREELVLSHSGTVDDHITFGAYGMGAKPRILGSEQVTGWTEVQTDIWESANQLDPPRERENGAVTDHPASIFFGAGGGITWGNMEDLHLNGEGAPTALYECDEDGPRFSLLDREYDWCWQDERVYVYSTEDPSAAYDFVEVPQRIATITQDTHPPQEYITIDGLELKYPIKYGYDDGWPMNVVVRGLTVNNCHIGFVGTKGAASAMGLQIWHSDMVVHNNEIHDCGRRNISYNVYGDVRDEGLIFENVVFQYNTLHHGTHTTGFDISGGYGDDTFRDFVFRNNFIWDDPNDDPENHPNDFTSMGIYLAGGTPTFTDFKVYNNVLKHIKQKHIVLAGVRNTEVFNNTLYGMNERAGGSGYRGMVTVSGDIENLRIDNNIFYGDVQDQFVLSCVTFSGSSQDGTTMNRNLYYQENSSQNVVNVDSGSSYDMDDWDDYLSDMGWDADSPEPQDPSFEDAAGFDFRLREGSAAIDMGANETDRSSDFAGNPIVGDPDIGALEHQ